MARSKNLFILISILILLTVTWLVISGVNKNALNKTQSPIGNESQNLQAQTSIAFDNGIVVNYKKDPLPENLTALDLLNETVRSNDIKLSTSKNSEGKLLVEIAGQKNSDEMTWTYFVNGQKSTLSPDQYKVAKNDNIEWKYISTSE